MSYLRCVYKPSQLLQEENVPCVMLSAICLCTGFTPRFMAMVFGLGNIVVLTRKTEKKKETKSAFRTTHV